MAPTDKSGASNEIKEDNEDSDGVNEDIINLDDGEEEDDVISNVEEDVAAMIFEKTMKRNKKASFKRTSPSEQPKHAE